MKFTLRVTYDRGSDPFTTAAAVGPTYAPETRTSTSILRFLPSSRSDATAVLDPEVRTALCTAGISAFDYRWGEMQLTDTQIYHKDALMWTVRLLCARAAQ